MPVIKGTGPLPPDHPFAGTRIVFIDALMKRRVQEQRARDQNPMREAEQGIEDFLRSRCSPPVSNDVDGGDHG